jgi:hypothetical protein
MNNCSIFSNKHNGIACHVLEIADQNKKKFLNLFYCKISDTFLNSEIQQIHFVPNLTFGISVLQEVTLSVLKKLQCLFVYQYDC